MSGENTGQEHHRTLTVGQPKSDPGHMVLSYVDAISMDTQFTSRSLVNVSAKLPGEEIPVPLNKTVTVFDLKNRKDEYERYEASIRLLKPGNYDIPITATDPLSGRVSETVFRVAILPPRSRAA